MEKTFFRMPIDIVTALGDNWDARRLGPRTLCAWQSGAWAPRSQPPALAGGTTLADVTLKENKIEKSPSQGGC